MPIFHIQEKLFSMSKLKNFFGHSGLKFLYMENRPV